MTQEQDLLEPRENNQQKPKKTAQKRKTTPKTEDLALENEADEQAQKPKAGSASRRTGRSRSHRALSVPLTASDTEAARQSETESMQEQTQEKPVPAVQGGNALQGQKNPPGLAHKNSQARSKGPRNKTAKRKSPVGEIVFNPEAFTDIYPSIADTILHTNPHQDDGPQPALPNQPSLALPPSQEDEAFLLALDEQINGNRIQESQIERLGRKGKKARTPGSKGKTGDSTTPNNQKPTSTAAIEKTEPQTNNLQPAVPVKESLVQESRKDKKLTNSPDQDAAAKTEQQEKIQVNRTLYVSVVPEEQIEVLITEEGQVAEYFMEMAHQAKIRGNIYKGVINNVDANLQAAFVNFGAGKNGFLQIDEVHSEYYLNHVETRGGKYPPIQKVLKTGQEVLVQVVKEPSGSKGAFLTTWVSLAGRFLVLTPGLEQLGISRKVEDQEERSRLKELLSGLKPGPDLGLILRTAGQDATKTSINKDLQYLKRLWKDIRKRVSTEPTPSLIYQEADLAARALRDYLNEDISEIWVDDAQTQASIQETTNLLFPRRPNMVKLHQDPRQTLWERFNLQRQIEEITSRDVVLPSGGRLFFDQTEALMAIDINSGKVHGKPNGFEDMVYKTNLEAARVIAQHLRLRDIGGQVVIDFIEMRDKAHVREVEKILRNSMRSDRARHDIGHISPFGLLELVRQRIGSSAISISSEPCPHCRGTGVRRNMEWQALSSLRDVQAKLRKLQAQAEKNKGGKDLEIKPLVYETDAELGLYLLNHKRDRLLELENTFQTRIDVIPKT